MSPVPETESSPTNQLEAEISEKYKKILKSNGIHDEIMEVVIKDAGLQGEGFLSQTNIVTINFKNPSLHQLNLFVKMETSNASHSEFLEQTNVFEKESSFFMRYIPKARELCESKGQVQLMDIYPKCYYGDGKMIVFENLVLDKGYALLDKIEQQDFEAARHVTLAITNLAKHHAISYAMIREVGGADELFKILPSLKFEALDCPPARKMCEGMVENGIKTIIQTLEKSNAKNKEEAIMIFKEKLGKAWDLCLETMKTNPDDEDPFLVLNHGDYWNNNMMFCRDKETNKLKSHKAIDFQVVRYGSAGLDLGYFIYSSIKPEVRRAKVQDLLKIYLEVLNDTSHNLGHPTNLSFEKLFKEYRKKIAYGIWFMGICTVSSASYVVIKDIDITKIDMNDFATVYADLVHAWILKNPETCERDAELMVELAMEYKNLRLDNA